MSTWPVDSLTGSSIGKKAIQIKRLRQLPEKEKLGECLSQSLCRAGNENLDVLHTRHCLNAIIAAVSMTG